MKLTGPDLAYAVMNEFGIISQLASTELSRALGPGLNTSEFTVLNHFIARPEPASPTHLAKAFQLTKPSMTAILTKLEGKGLVNITPSETDRRQKWVTLSEAGRKVHSAAIERLEPALQTLIDAIGDARLKAIHPLLVEFRTFLDEARNLRDFGAQRPKPSDP